MAKTKISEWSATPANNTDIDNINIAEGCAPSGINDAIREMMAQIKDLYAGTSGDIIAVAAGGTGVGTSTGSGSNVLSTSPTLVTPALGTPSALVGTNITGTATSFNINGTVGATTPTTGAFTTLAASSTVTLSGGTANGVAYLNGSKVVTSGSALSFDGTTLKTQANFLAWSGGASVSAKVGVDNGVADSGVYYDVSGSLDLRSRTSFPLLLSALGSTYTAFNINGSEQMRLTSTGLGIGTSTIGARLTTQASANTYPSGALQINSLSGTYKSYITNVGGLLLLSNSSSTDQLILDSSGNLGLGVTPSAWFSVYRALQIGSYGSAIAGQTNDQALSLWNNAFPNASAVDTYTTTSTATKFRMESGQFKFFNAPSGTAGNAITFTQAMTLDASGNLAIGSTSANGMRFYAFGYSPEIYDPTTYSAKFAYYPKGSQEAYEISTGSTLKAGYGTLINISVNDNNGSDQVYYGAVAQSAGNSGANFVFGRRTGTQTWAESARIDSSGNLLVGTTSVTGAGASVGQIVTNFNGTVQNGMYVSDTNTSAGTDNAINFGRGATLVGRLDTTLTTLTLTNLSDKRVKINIQNSDSAIGLVSSVKVRKFDWTIDNTHEEFGFVAQELNEILPQAVSVGKTEDEMWGVNYVKLIPILTKAMQEQQAIIESLKARLDAANL
jgi:hypothetical protein